jgi:cob(I)alamin adenosyltransferase
MSIVTKTGDQGTTALMYNRRVPKHHPRVEAYGTVDELNASLGLARATAQQESVRRCLGEVQKDLPRYIKDGYPLVRAEMTARLEIAVKDLEAHNLKFSGWAIPGNNLSGAALDMARTVCRRAERGVCALHEQAQLQNPEIIIYLNRLADLLWLLARREEQANPEPISSETS